jgi:hypothetical protein
MASSETKSFHGHPDPSLPSSHTSITTTEEHPWVLTAPWDESLRTTLVVGDTISSMSVANETQRIHHFCTSFPNEFLPFSAYAITEKDPAKRIAAQLEQSDWEDEHRTGLSPSANSGIDIPKAVLIVVQAREEPHLSVPIGWPTARRLLLENGIGSPSYLKLELTDPQLNKIIWQYFGPAGDLISVGGISIERRVIPLACSVLLLGAACILIGTWASYRAPPTGGEDIKGAWVILNTDSGLSGAVCLGAAAVLSLITLATPAYALLRTTRVAAQMQGADKTSLVAFAASLAVAMIVLVLNIVGQFRLRGALKAQRLGATNSNVDTSIGGG